MESQIKQLKVKVKSLAAEARMIRLEEHRAKGRRKSPFKFGMSMTPGKANPDWYVFLYRDDALRHSLWCHRVYDVRAEQRSALLAYAFLRGREYKRVEPKCYKRGKPDWERVAKLVNKFGNAPGRPQKAITVQHLAAWAEGRLDSHPSVNPFARPAKVAA